MTEHLHLLGGAQRGKTRARGFAPWRPQEKARQLVATVWLVLEEYGAHWPLTIRQVFYRLVAAHGYPKTERAYGNLIETVGRARRAELLPMDAFRDDGGHWERPVARDGARETLEAVARYWREHFRLDRQRGQERHRMVWCEAAGMVPQVARMVRDYGWPVFSLGGFDGLSEKHGFAFECAEEEGHAVEVLHVGDHDPSGVHVFLALAEDVAAFAGHYGTDVEFTRLAVTPAQIAALGLETAPPKSEDARAFAGETCQAEAIPPDELERILRDAAEERLDRRAFQTVLRIEREERRKLRAYLRRLRLENEP